jgi:Fe-S-cluster containining protein
MPPDLYILPEDAPLTLNSTFRFSCHSGLACFNHCCREPTIILSPYDILRLKQRLGLTSGDFLGRYTRQIQEEHSRLPLLFLRLKEGPEGGCTFLKAQGCTVYADRPAACRLFPITQGSRWAKTGVEDFYFCRRLDYCQGFDSQEDWTVASWIDNQGFAEYDQGRRPWLELILRLGQADLPPPDPQAQTLFFQTLYDLDNFRRFVFESAFLRVYGLEREVVEHLHCDAAALLRFAYAYLQASLFLTEIPSRQETLRRALLEEPA